MSPPISFNCGTGVPCYQWNCNGISRSQFHDFHFGAKQEQEKKELSDAGSGGVEGDTDSSVIMMALLQVMRTKRRRRRKKKKKLKVTMARPIY